MYKLMIDITLYVEWKEKGNCNFMNINYVSYPENMISLIITDQRGFCHIFLEF